MLPSKYASFVSRGQRKAHAPQQVKIPPMRHISKHITFVELPEYFTEPHWPPSLTPGGGYDVNRVVIAVTVFIGWFFTSSIVAFTLFGLIRFLLLHPRYSTV